MLLPAVNKSENVNMNLPAEKKEYYFKQILAEFEDYGQSRIKDVARNAETPQLAALLVEKYGYGLAKALFILGFDTQGLYDRIDTMIKEIDPQVKENRKLRWEARPADIIFNAAAGEMPV